MLANAKSYNADESSIFKSASRLKHVLADKFEVLMKKKKKFIEKYNSNRVVNSTIPKKYAHSISNLTFALTPFLFFKDLLILRRIKH